MSQILPRIPALRACFAVFAWALACMAPGMARGQAATDAPTTPPLVLTEVTSDSLFALETAARVIQIGDPVRVELRSVGERITPDRIEEVAFTDPPSTEQWMADGAWQREFLKRPNGEAGLWYLVLRPFDTGELPIPGVTVSYRDAADALQTAQIPPGKITVTSIRPPKQAPSSLEELLWLRNPAAIPGDWEWLWQLAAIVAALMISVFLIARWLNGRKRGAAQPTEPQLPPGLWALRELDLRSQLPVCQTGPAKAIFTLVSEVIRLYIGRRYGIAALEMTTLETLQALHPVVQGDEVLRWLQQFLEECDMVKFTRQEPPRGRWVAIWDDARLIVKLTTSNEELGGAGGMVVDAAQKASTAA